MSKLMIIKVLTILFTVLIVLLFARLWIGAGSYPRVWELNRQIDYLNKTNDDQKKVNGRLLAEIEEFKKGNDAVEELARSDLGMIEKGESFYQVILNKSTVEVQAVNPVTTKSDE